MQTDAIQALGISRLLRSQIISAKFKVTTAVNLTLSTRGSEHGDQSTAQNNWV
jgi:hypothetical protein